MTPRVHTGGSGQARGGGTAWWGIGWVPGGQKPSPKSQLLALALSWGADYRLLVGGRHRLLCGGSEGKAELVELGCGEGSNVREAKPVPSGLCFSGLLERYGE